VTQTSLVRDAALDDEEWRAGAYARELDVAEGRVRAWVGYMIRAGVLQRAKCSAAIT
jgi:hypothetical protein